MLNTPHRLTPAELAALRKVRTAGDDAPLVTARLPLYADQEHGVITPSCTDRAVRVIPARVGIAMRIGGEAFLCFDCEPDGGVYHPEAARAAEHIADGIPLDDLATMTDVDRIVADPAEYGCA